MTHFTSINEFAVHANGKWLSSRAPSNSGAKLELISQNNSNGSDVLGKFKIYQFRWQSKASIRIVTSIRVYNESPIVIFKTVFPDGLQDTALCTPDIGWACTSEPLFRFPSMDMENGIYENPKGLKIEWNAIFSVAHITAANFHNSNSNGAMGGSPEVTYTDAFGTVVVSSPLSNFMTAYSNINSSIFPMKAGRKNLARHNGVSGEITSVEKNFQNEYIIFVGENGVTDTVTKFGKVMQKYHNVKPKIKDTTNSELGYRTDNGAFYYWWFHSTKPFTANQIIVQLSNYLKSLLIPFTRLQLDAWWYESPPKSQRAVDGQWACIENFQENPLYFNESLKQLMVESGISGYNLYHNYFCPTNVYEKLGYKFYNSKGGKGVDNFTHINPQQSYSFYRHVFSQGVQQGMIATEHDYQSTAYNFMPHLRNSTSNAEMWLTGMAKAAEDFGIGIQYCMSFPRYIMQGMLFPAVTNARVSIDYGNDGSLVNVGYTSLLANALGIRPSKDVFWTMDSRKVPGAWEGDAHGKINYTHPLIDVLVSTLTTGPVVFGDAINYTNKTLLMGCCRSDGKILSPSNALLSIDAFYTKDTSRFPSEGHVWMASTSQLSWMVLGFGISSNKNGYYLQHNDLYPKLGKDITMLVYRKFSFQNTCNDFANMNSCVNVWDIEDGVESGAPHILPGVEFPSYGNNSHTYLTIYPMISSFIFLGELNKYVSISPQRFSNVHVVNGILSVTVQGVVGETINVTAIVPSAKSSLKESLEQQQRYIVRVIGVEFSEEKLSQVVKFKAAYLA